MFHFFFFNDTATTEIYTLSLHDALPISLPVGVVTLAERHGGIHVTPAIFEGMVEEVADLLLDFSLRSEEHTSELQSRQYLVCRLLLEKKKNTSLEFILCYIHSTLSSKND